MKKRIVITGMGALAATGSHLEEIWSSLLAGNTGIKDIDLWDTNDWEYKKAAQLKDYNPKTMLKNKKLLKLISRQDVIGLNAAQQAIDNSQVLDYRDSLSSPESFNDRTGVYVASPGVKFNQQYDLMPVFAKAQGDTKEFGKVLFDLVHPMWLLRILSNNVLAYVGIQNQFKGPNQNIPNHGVSGTQAIVEAINAINENQMDRAVVVGYESAIEPQAQAYYASIGVLAKDHLKPFCQNRSGTILAEAGGALFIESLESAKERGAPILAEILAGDIVSEAKGILPVSKDGEGLQRVISHTLKKANKEASELGFIAAHANGTLNSDASEAQALKNLFGQYQTPVTGYKWSIGHTIAAAGILETILTVKALQEKMVPGVQTLEVLASDCQGINVQSNHQPISKQTALSITRGFSSLQGCLLLEVESL